MTLSILSILAALILPSAQMISKRNKEIELKRDLRIIRNAIDDYKKTYDKLAADNKIITTINKNSGYPESFDVLIEGKDFGELNPEKKKFLRRVPCDPFNTDKTAPCKESWGMRSYADKPDSSQWGREDLYDVYSKSEDTAIDGTKYKDW